MPDYLYLEPDQLRASAERHRIAAEKVRKWGEIPRTWLDNYKQTRGSIAEPMRLALEDYYRRRHEKAERQADNHERTCRNLLEAARAIEASDHNSGAAIDRAGDFDSGPVGGRRLPEQAPTGPSTPSSILPPGQPAAPVTSGPAVPARSSPTSPEGIGEVAGATYPPAAERLVIPPFATGQDLPSRDTSMSGHVATSTDAVPSLRGAAPPGPAVSPPEVGPNSAADVTAGPPAPVPAAAPASAPAPLASRAVRPTPLARGPLLVAGRIAGDRPISSTLVVGERPEDDLILARTLLAATLAATSQSAPHLEWAAAVVRVRTGPLLLLTSSEGRGWLPSGLYLPAGVSTPWKGVDAFGRRARRVAALCEGVTDPARIFAELGRAFPDERVRISAIASSAVITGSVRESLDARTVTAEKVFADESGTNFGSPAPGLDDRLAVGGSHRLLERAALVPRSDIRSACLALAQEAHTKVCAATSGHDPDLVAQRAQRQSILESLQAGLPVPHSWIDEMGATEAMMAAAQRSRQVDLSHVPVGARADSLGAAELRAASYDRRATELLLLLTEREPDLQMLRDMFYAYGQIFEHPLFPADTASIASISTSRVADSPDRSVRTVDATGRAEVLPPAAQTWPGPAGPAHSNAYGNTVLGRADG